MLRLQSTRALSKLAAPARSNVRMMSAFSHMSDNDPEVLEKEKKEHLEKEEKKWNEKLASFSEASVKADQSEDKPIDVLQKESSAEMKKQHSEVKSTVK
ncbi:hypothetical protein K450DRAFT_220368 [Umbelopsis ramanniana AG]|uniref:Uncharacterized protein n=1 Tax=Umbelopsis ramanniana AG TaxID=1314678 RepID=A0AAD5HGU9_UMBRA|nr:uncharacterized protein K450DRAFT_220368 [Umbelopsis ramanniana AG]KAI8583875.1 hypothetical protein K450DRAFT_220368 [Umbelopsis ramanniana AG]